METIKRLWHLIVEIKSALDDFNIELLYDEGGEDAVNKYFKSK